MARADLLCDIIEYGLNNDKVRFRKAAEAICAEERSKQHKVLANKIEKLLKDSNKMEGSRTSFGNMKSYNEQLLCWEKEPQRSFSSLILPDNVIESCQSIVEEQMRGDLLRSYGLEPRNKLLLIGPPGNGKTSLAEAIAEALCVPLLTVRYENIVGAYLGETANKLSKLIDYAKTRQCVLFFDEFETLGKERGDMHETGEIKRVVSSLLLHIDSLPSYVVVIGATNHENLLDKAAWRRFQVKLEIPKPTQKELKQWFAKFESDRDIKFGVSSQTIAKKVEGLSYAEAEELALSIYRQYVLSLPNENCKKITQRVINLWQQQINQQIEKVEESEDKCLKDH